VFFGVEIILREFAIDALFTVMLSAMIADITAVPFVGSRPFLPGFPSGLALRPSRRLPAGRDPRGSGRFERHGPAARPRTIMRLGAIGSRYVGPGGS
jgi:hypothetical protein